VTPLTVLLVVLATYRLTILLTQDTITRPGREWLDRRYTGSLVEFVHCPWCVSVWLGAGATALAYYEWSWWRWVCLGLAASGVTGFLAERS
jgi:uncharacterized protein (DUF2062 family)